MTNKSAKYSLKKNEILSKKDEINDLFTTGDSFLESFIVTYFLSVNRDVDETPVKVLFSVPKKKITKAAKRNLVKRRLKEAYRLNKIELINHCKANKSSINIAFVYNSEEIENYSLIEKKIILSLQKIIDIKFLKK